MKTHMDQILHILQKDLRRLRWEIATVTFATLLLAWLNGDNRLVVPVTRQEQTLNQFCLWLTPLNVLAWWFLLVSLIHGEVIPGVRQFWLTRPYRRGALLGAKLLFVLLCINLPVLLADAIALSRAGISPATVWTGMLWKQVLFTLTALLPGLASPSSPPAWRKPSSPRSAWHCLCGCSRRSPSITTCLTTLSGG